MSSADATRLRCGNPVTTVWPSRGAPLWGLGKACSEQTLGPGPSAAAPSPNASVATLLGPTGGDHGVTWALFPSSPALHVSILHLVHRSPELTEAQSVCLLVPGSLSQVGLKSFARRT